MKSWSREIRKRYPSRRENLLGDGFSTTLSAAPSRWRWGALVVNWLLRVGYLCIPHCGIAILCALGSTDGTLTQIFADAPCSILQFRLLHTTLHCSNFPQWAFSSWNKFYNQLRPCKAIPQSQVHGEILRVDTWKSFDVRAKKSCLPLHSARLRFAVSF